MGKVGELCKNCGEKSSGTFCSLECMCGYRRKNCYGIGKCKICGKIFRYKKSAYSGNYCSKRCAQLSHCKPESWEFKICLNCEKQFKAKVYHKQKYCSRKCSGRAWKGRIAKICLWCRKPYKVIQIHEAKSKYCSIKCLNNWLNSDKEIKEKMVQSLRKRFENKENHPFYGRNHKEETKEKISKANKGKLKGRKNPNWHGGKSSEPYTLDFNNELRAQIRERDNYQCQLCGLKQNGRKLPIHHINYDKDDHQKINLVTLCINHHPITNYNRKEWQFFFESYQEIRLMRIS